jgi:hypothetical protein
MANSTAGDFRRKPVKPHEGFSLFPHATNRWAKKIRGKLHYFGAVRRDLPDFGAMLALDEYNRQAPDLHAGRRPRPKIDGTTVAALCDAFLNAKRARVESGEMTTGAWGDYLDTCAEVVKAFSKARVVADLTPADFQELRAKLAKRLGPTTLRNEIGRIRVLFKWGSDQKLHAPVDYGGEFAKPTRKAMRKARREAGVMMFEPVEIKAAIRRADWPLKAMILLGANAGLGPTDISTMPLSFAEQAVVTGWLAYPRPKTEIDRRARLWARTRAALRRVLSKRPTPTTPEAENLAFVTKYGKPWVRVEQNSNGRIGWKDSAAQAFSRVLTELGIKRGRLGLYGLRRGVQTVGEEVDPPAVSYIMGHVAGANDMAAVYRQRITDERLERVAEHLRKWLFSAEKEGGAK